jgi:5-methylthioadenosine/S-adenosylhomocysteine deaminase
MLKHLVSVLIALSATFNSSSFAQDSPCSLHGIVVTSDAAKDEWVTFQKGKITAISADKPANSTNYIELDGYVYPGLIDTHNHIHYNTIPQWNGGQFPNRYAWQIEPEYLEKVEFPFSRQVDNKITNDAILYGEVRSIIGGATMIQSNYHESAPKQLIRNLDLGEYHAEASTGPIDKISDVDASKLAQHLSDHTSNRLFFHIAEGKKEDATTQAEFAILGKKKFWKPGVVVIHGIALGPNDFQTVKSNGMYLVWSPRSNLRLYGQTLDLPAALDAGVTVAIAPDWTITGSSNMLDELRFANNFLSKRYPGKFTAQNIFDMATKNAALVAGVEKQLGSIEVGKCADFLVTKKLKHLDKVSNQDQLYDPYTNLLKLAPADVELVFVNGRPVYGDSKLMTRYVPNSSSLKVGAADMKILIENEDGSDHINYTQLENRIKSVLPSVAPLYEP